MWSLYTTPLVALLVKTLQHAGARVMRVLCSGAEIIGLMSPAGIAPAEADQDYAVNHGNPGANLTSKALAPFMARSA